MKRPVIIRIIIGSFVFAIILELAHDVSGFWLKSFIAAVAGVGGASALALLRAGVVGVQCDCKNWVFGLKVLICGIGFGLLWTFGQTLSDEWLRLGVAALAGMTLVLGAQCCWRRATNL